VKWKSAGRVRCSRLRVPRGCTVGAHRLRRGAFDGVRGKVSPLYWVVTASAALSGFFSLTGFALRSFRRAGLDESFAGPQGQKRLANLEAHLKALRLTTSLCGVLADLVIIAALMGLFDAAGSLWRTTAAIAVAAAVIGIFGVAIPNAWAAYAGQRILARTLGVLMFLRYALWPVTAVMLAFDVPVRRLTGAGEQKAENGENNAKQEILQAASEGQAEGAVEPEEVQMIESVMEFGETHAAEIMTPRTDIFALPVETPWSEAIEKIVRAGHTRVPVFEADIDHIIGILYAKDMLKYASQDHPPDLRSVMRKCYFVPETKQLDELLKEFKARKVHLAVVLDEYGGTAGIVTIEDVVEEIVGEIADEYDVAPAAAIKRIDDRTIEADGRLYVDELNDELGLNLPEDDDYDTVAGFIFSELGYIPTVGETLESCGARFTILAADERKITRINVQLLEEPEDPEE